MSEIKGTIVDVRTREEFSGGHVPNSINIPLQEILEHETALFEMESPVIFCCASGGRSGQAAHYFQSKGLSCENGGGWMEVNFKLNH